MPCVASDVKTPKVSAFEKYAIDVEPIPLRLKKNREVHLHYIKRLKENVETLREIVEAPKVGHPSVESLKLGTLNDLARKDLVRGLPRLKFEKDHLCSACQLGKSRKVETDIKQKDKKKAKNSQTRHGIEKTESNQCQSQSKSKDSQVEEIQLGGRNCQTSS
ncbi:hypothetical protein Tco_0719278 [Tanacetum coccineum]